MDSITCKASPNTGPFSGPVTMQFFGARMLYNSEPPNRGICFWKNVKVFPHAWKQLLHSVTYGILHVGFLQAQ